ncbi:phage antirepressor [Corynebacterium argentoratense]|uniref:phage antirepressor n=1 Tax=Corynebacterium argentoratense TaxID=42817 RepID=UPI001F1DD484|nr:phage antirepressor KilAC domain-containing protein [Corynebacterium argentoratense]MCF1712964.1 phage antirepressor KilAC domain-containing protein [Corynebacterium argentoratense]
MELQTFNFDRIPVRTVVDEEGEWFCGRDVAEALGYKRTADAISQHVRGSVIYRPISDNLGREQQAKFITEPDVMRLIISSKLPAAQRFERWVFEEVLPQIRRTGSYNANQFNPADLTRAEILRIALNAEEERLALEAKNKELEPKADAYDTFIDATGKYNVGTVAKMLGMGQNKLFKELRNRGVFIAKGANANTPYQRYMQHFEVKAYTFEHSNGEQVIRYTTYVQPSGVDFIRRKLGFDRIDPPSLLNLPTNDNVTVTDRG